jgi:hypothetical protein
VRQLISGLLALCRPRASRPGRRSRPSLEMLESRLVPAVTFRQVDLDGDGARDDVRIVGDAQNTRVVIGDDGAGIIAVSIDANSDGDFNDAALGDLAPQSLSPSGNSASFDLRLGGGADQVFYSATAGFKTGLRSLLAGLGGGNDLFLLNAGLVQNRSALRLDVRGGSGADFATFGFGAVSTSSLSIRAALGAGDDQGNISFSGNIDFDASAEIGIDLGTGDNELDVTLESVGFTGLAEARIDITGGDDPLGRDDVSVTVHNDVGNGTGASRLSVRARLFAGNDVFETLLDRTDFRVDDGSTCVITARGGEGNDVLTVTSGDTAGLLFLDPGSLLDLRLFGDGGRDEVGVAFGSVRSPDTAVQLLGTLRARVDGGEGGDTLFLATENNNTSTGSYDLALFGRGGNDRAFFRIIQFQGTPTFNPAALLSGGAGKDTLENVTPAGSVVKLFEVFPV